MKTLDDFSQMDIRGIVLWRFKVGNSVTVTAEEIGIPRERVREIENAILNAVEKGKTARLDKDTIKAAREMLKKRKKTDAETPA